ncbi:Uncharacterised protein [Enterobacter hormaechei]|nr:Uncharacterised protein [Enterobacter hormaechei]
MMRQEVVKVLANEESNPAELEAESRAPRSELLAFRQPQLRGHVQKCWRNSLSGRAAGRRTAGKPSPLRDPPRHLDIQVVLSSSAGCAGSGLIELL